MNFYYRPNVGLCILNQDNLIFTGNRFPASKEPSWQMPQGGVETLDDEELLLKGMFRELYEETGISQSNVKILGRSHKVKYEFTEDVVFKNKDKFGSTIGQEQIWFFLRFLGKDLEINLKADKHQEFFDWKWETPYFLIDHVMQMKKSVYKDVLSLLIQNNYFK